MSFNEYLASKTEFQLILKDLDGATNKDYNTVKHLITILTLLAWENIKYHETIVEIIEQYILLVRENLQKLNFYNYFSSHLFQTQK